MSCLHLRNRNEHRSMIDSSGHAWFSQFGKNNVEYDTIALCNPILLSKSMVLQMESYTLLAMNLLKMTLTKNERLSRILSFH